MFDTVKRLLGLGPTPAEPPQPSRSSPKRWLPETGPSPLPDVVESDDETAWNLWQESVGGQTQSPLPSPHGRPVDNGGHGQSLPIRADRNPG
jgi:hypothetical protein